MVASLTHRGPDDEGIMQADGIALGMRRLSVIDLAGGHQPMFSEDGKIAIVLNGEIYNFMTLRRELAARGHRFRTRSDTEVVLRLYEEYGDACVTQLDGMFALAIYDARPSAAGPRLFIARDPLGKKPFYYADVSGALIFGSEPKALLHDDRVSRALDDEAIHHFLSLRLVPAPLSIYRDIRKLPAGCQLVCDRRGLVIKPYWRYLDHVQQRRATAETVPEIRRLLHAAVEKRLVAEVPVGAFLSGGLDSGAVVALLSRLSAKRVNTFSLGFEGPTTHNELPRARLVARHCGTDHHELLVKPDIVELLPEMAHFFDEPFAVSSAMPTYLLARAARQSVTVVLTGDGGDEVFGGYSHYLFERWARLYRRAPLPFDRVLLHASRRLGLAGRRANRFSERMQHFLTLARQTTGARRLGWMGALSEDAKRSLHGSSERHPPTSTWLEKLLGRDEAKLPAETQANILDVLLWLPDEMLTKVDRMTMACSLEARSPLLDRQLVEFMAGLSFEDKASGYRQSGAKTLLRQAVAELLPPQSLATPKWGFNVPLAHWFQDGTARRFLTSRLSAERTRRWGFVDAGYVAQLLARYDAGEHRMVSHLFTLLVLDVWLEGHA